MAKIYPNKSKSKIIITFQEKKFEHCCYIICTPNYDRPAERDSTGNKENQTNGKNDSMR